MALEFSYARLDERASTSFDFSEDDVSPTPSKSLASFDLEEGDAGRWEAIPNLDKFFSNIYNYFYEKGYRCIIAARLSSLLTLAFTVLFSTFLLAFVNWRQLLQCDSEETCRHIHSILRNPFDEFGMWELCVFSYFIVLSTYWLWSLYCFFLTLKETFDMRTFYRERLGISEEELSTVEWWAITEKLIQLQDRYRFCIVKDKLTALDIANRIMRKDNFMIALTNKNLLRFQLPVFGRMFTKTLEWNIQFCLFDYMFDKNFHVKKSFLGDSNKLKRRFIFMGLLNLLFLGPILIFMIVFNFLRHAEEFHSQRTYGQRQWTPLAQWLFREFNELPHLFKRRLNASFVHAESYLAMFPSTLVSIIARCISFIAGSFLGVLLMLTFFDESLLLYIKIAEKNFLWYIAVFGTVVAICRGLINDQRGFCFEPEEAIKRVVQYTHFMPPRWRGRCHRLSTRNEFAHLFQYRVVLLIEEILSVVYTPFVLIFSLPKLADEIVQFIRDFTVDMDGVGHVCGFGLFDFQKYGNIEYAAPAPTKTDSSVNHKKSKSNPTEFGKMEKSFMNFKLNNPTWQSDQAGDQLMSNLVQFQQSQSVDRSSKFGDLNSSMNRASLTSSLMASMLPMQSDLPALANEAAMMAPLSEVRMPLHENYYYWLEQYYDSHAGALSFVKKDGSRSAKV
eukprot:GILK01003783.1.p1 GENE.GILK01003783.1~~GILK01003783.1.p1  ORF type:complete len:674 (+),score=105.22 GILK01003783.1:92-2113(+)